MSSGIIGRHVASRAWVKDTYVETVGEVVACDLRDDDTFVLLVARDDGSLATALDHDVRILGAAEFKRLLRNERRRRQQSQKTRKA